MLRIYFGSKTNNYCFNKSNSKDIIKQISTLFMNNKFDTRSHFEYHKGDSVFINNKTYKRKIINGTIRDNELEIEFKLEPTYGFNQGTDYTNKIIEDQTIIHINEKICIVFTNKNYVYLEIVKDEYWDETRELMSATLSTIRTIYN